jgi:hypothetical protein
MARKQPKPIPGVVQVSLASERRADRLNYAIAGDRSSRSRSFDAQPPGLWVAGSEPSTFWSRRADHHASRGQNRSLILSGLRGGL